MSQSEAGERHLPSRWLLLAGFLALALIVGLRLVALDSDHYPRLTWSSALLTDEGFYIHNARNLILYGHPVTDEWNNMLMMPTLHFAQVGFFSLFGVGSIQARMLTVCISLITLPIFFAATRRAFGVQVACFSALFLGLDHVNLLYSRIALMDPPAAFVLCAAYYAFVRALPPRPEVPLSRGWLTACGAILGVAYATRGLVAFLFPAPYLALYFSARARGLRGRLREVLPAVIWLTVGLAVVMTLYGVVWLLPHKAEMSQMNRFYLREQLLPASLQNLRGNIVHAFIGDHRGMSPYLFRHTPIQFGLALSWLIWWRRRGLSSLDARAQTVLLLVAVWMLILWGFLAVVSYSPSRYYVLFYPAMAVLAAFSLVHLKSVLASVYENRRARTALAGFLGFHLGLALGHHDNWAWDAFNYGLTASAAGVAWFLPTGRLPRQLHGFSISSAGALVLLWVVMNAAWMTDWLGGLTYQRRDADRWLAEHLPRQSVLFGAIAPGLCLDNDHHPIMMIKGLANWRHPVEKYSGAPRYVVILGEEPGSPNRWRFRWKERYWVRYYPDVVAPGRDIKVFPRILRPMFYVRVYPVPPESEGDNAEERMTGSEGLHAGARIDENPRRQNRSGRYSGRDS